MKIKFLKTKLGVAFLAGFLLMAADHIEAPAVAGGTSDITDFYAFQAENTSNVVFVANVQGLISPTETANAAFDEQTLVEFNIDTDNDNVEDLIIQAIPRDGKMYFFGPFSPSSTGLNSTISENDLSGAVSISTYGANPALLENSDGMKFFAGPRDDPFFMDFAQYSVIIGGTATSFNDPGSDTFAGTNVMSIVVEVPKSMVGGSGTINTWVETKRKS